MKSVGVNASKKRDTLLCHTFQKRTYIGDLNMDTQEKGVFFSLEEQNYKAVCEVANKQDKTLGQALSLLIAKGWEALEAETELDSRYSVINRRLAESLSGISHTALWIHQEVERLNERLEKPEDESLCLELVEQEEE